MHRVSDVLLDSEKVEGLCFPMLFCHGKHGYTNKSKSRLSPDAYAMARLMRPEKSVSEYMTAHAGYVTHQCIDSHTGELVALTELQSQVEEHKLQGISIRCILRVNRFMLLARVTRYWLMDFYLRVLDQRMSIIGKMRNWIMMGQTRQISDKVNENEEQDMHAAGYFDEPKKESYLPSSVHGSQCHMAALAKNALVLVSKYGSPHLFLTLTCNPKWPEIVSQSLDDQTAFDRPDVTAVVFKSRLDQLKMNLRNGKYFDGRELMYSFHGIEYQYCGLSHAHLVAHLSNAPDINDQNHKDLINFVNNHFVAEKPCFEGEEHQNVYTKNGESEFTQEYKRKAVEMVQMHNTLKCSTAINGCKKDCNAQCKCGYSRGETVLETFVNKVTNRIVYQRRMEYDLKIVPCNLQMIMDWDSHINVEYS